jgi:DNA replicative helicase MCM subunit Mcm2 (Cdc46/Mcm family)
MAGDPLGEARRLIEERLSELRRETRELEGALRSLGRGGSTKRRSSSPATKPRRGKRSEQFKQALAKSPGARVSEIAKKIGVSAQQAHGIAKRLREKGEIKKQGRGYALKA